jgi:hypothetical protein
MIRHWSADMDDYPTERLPRQLILDLIRVLLITGRASRNDLEIQHSIRKTIPSPYSTDGD